MEPTTASISRAAITKLLIGAVVLLGLLGLFVALAGNASAGGDTKITVNSIANIDDGECEGAPNDDEIGNCTLHEAIDMVNDGDADIINFHKPVFSKEQPGVIELCEDDLGELPDIRRNIVIDSKNSGVILDGGSEADNKVLKYLNPLDMTHRRHICVCLISKTLATLDNMAAFAKSVNFVLGEGDLDKITDITRQAVLDNENFFSPWKEAMREAGKV